MKYICHKRFKGISIDNYRVNIPYGTPMYSHGDFIYDYDGHMICAVESEVGIMYFSKNEDGLGLERGEITYRLAYSKRHRSNGYRFSDEEQELLRTKWNKFLRKDCGIGILFNQEFFDGDILELREMDKDFSKAR